MSFNTRSGRSIGRGLSQTQVTYHQVPPRPLGQQFVPQSQQPTYQSQQPPQQTPVAQQAQQQFKTTQSPQQQPQQQQSQQQQQQPLQQQQPQQQQQATPLVQTKVEPVTPARPPQSTPAAAAQDAAQTGDGTDGAVRPWKKHKNPTFKVNKVQKKRRQNARFRKLLIPKNAIMVLNELQPGILFEAEEHVNAFNQATYIVKLEIDGQVYSGEGSSKGAAKAAAAESAVKGLILKKIAESNIKKDLSENEEQAMDTGSGDDTSDKGSVNGRRSIPEDEVPWGSLASFALFKLFADWKAQGCNIPPVVIPSTTVPKPVPKPMAPKVQGQPTARPTMPDNPELLHPVTLVGRVHPGTLFSELSREGNPPNMTFTMGVTINGAQYTGVAKSKKEAKKLCAINALKALGIPYNTNL